MSCLVVLATLLPTIVALGEESSPVVGCSGTEWNTMSQNQSQTVQQIKHDLTQITIPVRFDARDQWPMCKSLTTILHQGGCGGCWAFASASVMSDRMCIGSGGAFNNLLSTQDTLECCLDCALAKGGCDGGDTWRSFLYWEHHGVVTWSCKPLYQGIYQNKFMQNCREFCPIDGDEYDQSADEDLKKDIDYKNDKRFSVSSLYLKPENKEDLKQIQAEIMVNGPVVGSMDIYPYMVSVKPKTVLKSDRKLEFSSKGIAHAIKVIGWDEVDGVPVWIVANSWGSEWCNKGFCHIRRGNNDFGLEKNLFKTGLAKLEETLLTLKGKGKTSGCGKEQRLLQVPSLCVLVCVFVCDLQLFLK